MKRFAPREEPVVITPEKFKGMLLMFPYPIVISLVYLSLGFLLRLWHPTWLLYLTIPIYYMLAANTAFVELIYAAWQRRAARYDGDYYDSD